MNEKLFCQGSNALYSSVVKGVSSLRNSSRILTFGLLICFVDMLAFAFLVAFFAMSVFCRFYSWIVLNAPHSNINILE